MIPQKLNNSFIDLLHSVTLNGRSLKQPGFFLELASWPNWATDGEGLWLEWWRRINSSWAQWSYMQKGEIYRRTNITATLHRSGFYGGVVKLFPQWRQKKTHLEFTKKHLKDPQTEINYIIWSDEPPFKASCLNESRHCSSHAEYHPKSKVRW